MRIVAVADTHLFHADLHPVPDGDVLVHAGDLTRRGTLEELEACARWLAGLPHAYKVVVAGNHDWCFARDRARAVEALGAAIYLEDEGAQIGGVRFWGSPWQPSYHDWAFNLDRGPALRARWARIPVDTQVLVTHGPPAGFGDRSPVGGRQGCADLRAAVDTIAPCLHLFGHIHQDGGAWVSGATTFANVTTWECERPASVIDLDPATGRVTPVVVPPAGR